MRYHSIVILAACLLFCFSGTAQTDTSAHFKFSGYVDAYYAHYSDSAGSGNYQKFPAASPRSNSFGLNIAQITEEYKSDKIRATATIHFGDLPAAAWSPVFNYVQEAYAGVRLHKKLWLDAGFFKTHIGTEAFLPKDNIASSISIITFFEPWWQAGARLSYDLNSKCQMVLYVLNGYNEFVSTNKKQALGMVVNYTFNDKLSLGYYNFIGDNTPDTIKTTHLRFLNNLVLNYQLNTKLKIVLGVDYISQQHSHLTDSAKSAIIYSGILTVNYKFNPHWGIYARYEAYNDADGFLSGTMTDATSKLTGYKLSGYTMGGEYKPTDNSYIRLESRALEMDNAQKIFYTNSAYTSSRIEIMMNIGVWF